MASFQSSAFVTSDNDDDDQSVIGTNILEWQPTQHSAPAIDPDRVENTQEVPDIDYESSDSDPEERASSLKKPGRTKKEKKKLTIQDPNDAYDDEQAAVVATGDRGSRQKVFDDMYKDDMFLKRNLALGVVGAFVLGLGSFLFYKKHYK